MSQDMWYAIRQVRKHPGLIVLAVLTLGLGIGANTAIYGLLDQVLLRSLPVREPDRLVLLKYSGAHKGHISSRADDKTYFSYPMYRDLRDRNSVFSGVIATDWTQVGLLWHDQPELVATELVSGNYFEVLGVRPALGRLLASSDNTQPGADTVAVLSFSYWRRHFDADRSILNQTILVNSHPFTIIGVTQSGFHSVVMGDNPDLFVPMTMKSQVIPGGRDLEDRRSSWLNIVARLKPGISREQAEAGINPLWSSIRADELKQIANTTESFRENFVARSHLSLLDGRKGFSPLRSDLQTPLLILMAMVGLVALMACANVGGLLLVRAAGRLREMSVRYALGANRTRMTQQLLVEGLLLGLAGGIVGALFAYRISVALIKMLWGATGAELPFSSHLDLRIVVFNFTLAVLASLFFGFAPALLFWRPTLVPALKQQTITGRGRLWFRRSLVGLQVGLSFLLLVGAGLFMRTLHSLKAVDMGFATDHLLTFNLDPTLAGYQPNQEVALYSRVLGILTALPGVRSVAGTNDSELANSNWSTNITIAGYNAREDEDMNVENPSVSPGYFSSMGIPLLAGRELREADRAGTQKVAVVNESFARHFFGSPQAALQHYFAAGAGKIPDVEIVGVVKDSKHTGVRQQIDRTVFSPYLQDPAPNTMTFYVRTGQTPESAEAMIRQAMRTLDSKLVLDTFRTMQEQIDDNLATERMVAFLAESFGALAALMAAIGLYGVLAYSTAQRTSEIGIRMALGASRASVLRMVLAEVLWLTGTAIAVALPASLLLGTAVRKQLFGISSSDPLTLCLAIVTILVVAIASALRPAWRAAKIEPLVALRYE